MSRSSTTSPDPHGPLAKGSIVVCSAIPWVRFSMTCQEQACALRVAHVSLLTNARSPQLSPISRDRRLAERTEICCRMWAFCAPPRTACLTCGLAEAAPPVLAWPSSAALTPSVFAERTGAPANMGRLSLKVAVTQWGLPSL